MPVDHRRSGNDNFENSDQQITATTNGLHGTTTIVNGKVVYTPVAGYVGRDIFTYTVTSGGISETATVTVDMTNTPPVANPDTSTTPEDSTASGNVLTNDTDADNAEKCPHRHRLYRQWHDIYTPGGALTITEYGCINHASRRPLEFRAGRGLEWHLACGDLPNQRWQ